MRFEPEEFSKLSAATRLWTLTRSGLLAFLIVALVSFGVSAYYWFSFVDREQAFALELKLATEMVYQARERINSIQTRVNDRLDNIEKIANTPVVDPQAIVAQARLAKEDLLLLQRVSAEFLEVVLWRIQRRTDNMLRLRDASSAFSKFSMTSTAHAQATVSPESRRTTVVPDWARLWVMMAVFVVLGITFLGSVAAIFFVTNTEVLKFAFDTVKTLLGFFIGVATTLIGTA